MPAGATRPCSDVPVATKARGVKQAVSTAEAARRLHLLSHPAPLDVPLDRAGPLTHGLPIPPYKAGTPSWKLESGKVTMRVIGSGGV